MTLKDKLASLSVYMDPGDEVLLDRVLEVLEASRKNEIAAQVRFQIRLTIGTDFATSGDLQRLRKVESACEKVGAECAESATGHRTAFSEYLFI